VNRDHLRAYPSRITEELLAELSLSARELSAALSLRDPGTWDGDFGARHTGQTVTIRATVGDLIADYPITRRRFTFA
jgi:hypothetical protein